MCFNQSNTAHFVLLTFFFLLSALILHFFKIFIILPVLKSEKEDFLNACNEIRTHNLFVRKRKLHHLAKLPNFAK